MAPSRLDAVANRIEDDFNGKLRGLLDDLGYHDISADQFHSPGTSKPDGAWTFRAPDGRDALAIFSAKMGTVRQFTQALNTASQYKKTLGKLGVAEAFAVTYPEGKEKHGLYALESRWHPFHAWQLESLTDVARAIDSVLARRPPPPLEQPEATMIRLLRSAVGQVSKAFTKAAAANLVEVFGQDNPLFASIRPLGEPSKASEGEAREAGAYLLVNQLLFYHILSSSGELGLPRIDPETVTPIRLHPEYFARVLEVDYRPVFESDIASQLHSTEGTQALQLILSAFEDVRADRIGSDVIGKIFHNLIPLEKRKPVAAYYTNSNAAHLLAHIAIDNEFDRVMDPACGSGTMLVSSYLVKSELYRRLGWKFTMDVHEQFVGEHLTGIDLMPFSAHLAVVNLSLQAPERRLQKVRIAIRDSLELQPNQPVESYRSRLLRAAKLSVPRIESYGADAPAVDPAQQASGQFVVSPVDVVMMNPPFSDSDRIPRSYKTDIKRRFESAETSGLLQGKYSLQLPFLLLAHEFLNPKGRIAAVLPVTMFNGEAFAEWVRFVVQRYRVRALVVGFGRTAFSENTALSECLFVAEKTAVGESADASFVILASEVPPPNWDDDLVHRMAEAVRGRREESLPGLYRTKLVRQADLDPSAKGLQQLIQELSPNVSEAINDLQNVLRPHGIEFGELERKMSLRFNINALATKEQEGPHGRGLDYYCAPALTYFTWPKNAVRKGDRLVIQKPDGDAFIVSDKVTETTFTVPRAQLVPYARRISGLQRMDATEDLDYIASEYFRRLDRIIEHIVSTTPGLWKGTSIADSKQVYVGRIRDRWPRRVEQGRGRVWMARKVNLAAPGTSLLAAYSAANPMVGPAMWVLSCPPEFAWAEKGLVLWFNSTFFLAQVLNLRAETQGTWGGIYKHPLLRSIVPDITALDERQRREMEGLFDGQKDEPLPSIMDQLANRDPHRWAIDSFFIRILRPDLTVAATDGILAELYSGLFAELERKKRAM